MSKEATDVLGRLNGNLIALQNAAAKLLAAQPVQLPGSPNTTFEQQNFPAAAVPGPAKEEYDYIGQLIADLKAQIQTLEEIVKKETQAPPPPTPAEGESAPHKTKSSK